MFKLTPPRAAPRQREMVLHRTILSFLRAVLPRGAVLHHSANEFGMSGDAVARQIAKNKSMGMVVGWPDLEIIYRGTANFLEVKAPGENPSDAQKACHEAIRQAGCDVAVVRSIDDVRDALRRWKIETRETLR